MSRSESLAPEALSQHRPAILNVAESQDMSLLDPLDYRALLLPGDIKIADQYEKRRRNASRLGVCGVLRAGYINNPYVTHAVEQYAVAPEDRERVYELSPLRELETDASKHRTLEKGEAIPLFKALDHGVQTFVRLGAARENALPEDEQAFLEHTAAYSILLHTNLRLALNVARTRYGHSFSDDPFYKDIALETILALSRSLQLFNHNKGLALSTFCVKAIKTQTDRYISNNSRPIHIPAHIDQAHHKIMKASAKLGERIGGKPSISAIAAAANCSEGLVTELDLVGGRHLASLDQVVHSDEQGDKAVTLNEVTADPRAANAHQKSAEHNELVSTLDETVENAELSTAQKIVLSLRYKIFNDELEKLMPSVDYEGLFNEAAGKPDGLEPIKIARALRDAKLMAKASAPKVKVLEAEVLSLLAESSQLLAFCDDPYSAEEEEPALC